MTVVGMERWRGKVAVVTGASAGIGAAVAEKLVQSGLQVVGLARRLEKLQELSEQLSEYTGKLHYIKCDVSKEEEIIEAFKWTKENVGLVNILVNNAGVLREGFLYNGLTEDWRATFNTNVLGLMVCTREALAQMPPGGHVVHMNSVAGYGVPRHTPPCAGAYPASKHAVTALATQPLRPHRVTSVSPGLTRTAMYTAEDQERGLPCLLPQDVADAVMFALAAPPHVEVTNLSELIIYNEHLLTSFVN